MSRCESCGRFVRKGHLRTARYFYDIDPGAEVVVYSLATATAFQERLDCPGCSMRCCRMDEAKREHGRAVGRRFPNRWEPCSQQATAADYTTPTTDHRRPHPTCADDTSTEASK